VSNEQPEYIYCWVYAGQHGLQVNQKKIEGWEVVQGDDPEAVEHQGIGADTTRRVGDVILMRITKDRHLLVERRRRENAERFNLSQTTISPEARRLAEQNGIPVYDADALNPQLLDKMNKRSQARQIAGNKINQLLREGRMPGVGR